MSFSLPATITLPSSPPRHNLAIAEVVFFGFVLPIQLAVRYIQLRRHRDAGKALHPLRAAVRTAARAFWNFIVIFAILRLVGFAIYLATNNPSRSLVIVEVVLQSFGLSPLLLELSLTLLRCGRTNSLEHTTTAYPKVIVRLLQLVRALVLIAGILIIVAGSTLNLSLIKAGAAVMLATYVYLAGLAVLIAIRYRERLVQHSMIAVWFCIATLPLYLIRVIYLMLVEFGNEKYDPILGDWRYLVGMSFAMEVGIVILLVIAGIVAEPWWIEDAGSRKAPVTASGKTTIFDIEGVVDG